MKSRGRVSLEEESFDYQLHELGYGNALRLLDPSTGQSKDWFHIEVTLRNSDESENTVFMHPTGRQCDDLDSFVAAYLNRALEQFEFQHIPPRFDSPVDSESQGCSWC